MGAGEFHGDVARRSNGVVDVDVVDANDRLVAVGRGCFSLAASYPADKSRPAPTGNVDE